MDWLKAIYETFGTPYPRASLIAVMALGSICSGAGWLVLARQVAKVTGIGTNAGSVNTTNGPQSPIMPDNQGNVKIGGDTAKTSPPPPKDKTQ